MDEKRLKKILAKRKSLLINHILIILSAVSLSIFLGLIYFKKLFLSKLIQTTNHFLFIVIEIFFSCLIFLIIYFLRKNDEDKSEKNQLLIGLVLSSIFGTSICLVFLTYSKYYQLYLYFITLCIYHYAEYFSVLWYHFQSLSSSSYLIDQSKNWIMATGSSFIETIVETFFFDKYKKIKILFYAGLIMTIVGQYFRIAALFTGKTSFTHRIQTNKKFDHVLVTHGIYSISRHPSYFGFFLWSVGIEIMCVNPICIVSFIIVLFRFFDWRIKYEEKLLIEFFGYDYLRYKRKVPILIPFIKLDLEDEKERLDKYLIMNPDVQEIDNFFEKEEKEKKKSEGADDDDKERLKNK